MRKIWNAENVTTIKQGVDTKDCLACVAAMITSTTVKEFKDFCTKNNLCLWDDFSLYSYIRLYGYFPGVVFKAKQFYDDDGVLLFSGPAYLVVESDSEEIRDAGATHAVLWDGKKVRDPSPSITERALEDYRIHWVVPISQCTTEKESCDCGCGGIDRRRAKDIE